MMNLTIRNLKIFYRQKSSVFFSLMSVFIILLLYMVFLGDIWLENYQGIPNAEDLMYNWIMAGIVSVTTISTSMGAFGNLIDDRMHHNDRDFLTSPVKRGSIVGGYILSSYITGVLMSLLALFLGELYISSTGNTLLSASGMFKMAGAILLSAAAASSFVFFMVSFFWSGSAFSTASTILGTLIGFLTGIYLPIGSLNEPVQWVIRLFPLSHASVLMRQIMMETPMNSAFNSVPAAVRPEFEEMTGIVYSFGSYTATPLTHILVLTATAVLFFFCAVWNMSRKRK